MNDRHPVDTHKRKYTQAYIERWIRPLAVKPTHPHDTNKRYDEPAARDESMYKRN